MHRALRILSDTCYEREYMSNTQNQNMHDGQRKLYFSELEFLTNYFLNTGREESQTIVVYAGAAPGDHIQRLAADFPDVEFHLYDPEQFNPPLRYCLNVKLYQELFTVELAQDWADHAKSVLFICDIRSTRPDTSKHCILSGKQEDDRCQELKIHEDMVLQQSLFEHMRPQYALLKFRSPYHYDHFTPPTDWNCYLDGDLYFQVWAPKNSTELRLLVKQNAGLKTYDSKKIERQMAYFNQVRRAREGYDAKATRMIKTSYEVYLHSKLV